MLNPKKDLNGEYVVAEVLLGASKSRNETEWQNKTEATPTKYQLCASTSQYAYFLLCYGSLPASAALVR